VRVLEEQRPVISSHSLSNVPPVTQMRIAVNAQHTLPWKQDIAPGNWDKDKWELYNLNEDFFEANDLAARRNALP
jgi:hypothetical protein